MMAVSPPIANNNKPISSAMASGAGSPSARMPKTSARAMPIDTAVAATTVDSASSTVVINSTKATGRVCDSAVWRAQR